MRGVGGCGKTLVHKLLFWLLAAHLPGSVKALVLHSGGFVCPTFRISVLLYQDLYRSAMLS